VNLALRLLVLDLPAVSKLGALLSFLRLGVLLGALVLGLPSTPQLVGRLGATLACVVQRPTFFGVPAVPSGFELGAVSLLPFALRLLVLVRPTVAQGTEGPLDGVLVTVTEAGPNQVGLTPPCLFQPLDPDLFGLAFDALVFGLPALAELPNRALTTALRFFFRPCIFELRALTSNLSCPLVSFLRFPLCLRELGLPPFPRFLGLVFGACLCFVHDSVAIRIEPRPALLRLALQLLSCVSLDPFELRLPALFACTSRLFEMRFCLFQGVRVFPLPARLTLLVPAHRQLVLGLPAGATLLGFSGRALLYLFLYARVLSFPVRTTLLGLTQRASPRLSLGLLVLRMPPRPQVVNLAREPIVLCLPPTLAFSGLSRRALGGRLLGSLVLGFPARPPLVGRARSVLLSALRLLALEPFDLLEPRGPVTIRRRAIRAPESGVRNRGQRFAFGDKPPLPVLRHAGRSTTQSALSSKGGRGSATLRVMELAPATAELYIRHAFSQMRGVADRLGDGLVNTRPVAHQTNAVAALIVHCCAVTEFWIGHVALGRPSRRDREAEFSTTATVGELHAMVDATLAQVDKDLAAIESGKTQPDRTGRQFLLEGDEGAALTDSAIVLHVLEELYQHLGHMEIAADALTIRG
jgi:Protein of unknown function (DUF664)